MRATASRGLLGFTAATVAADAACNLPPLRQGPCPGGPGDVDATCVSNLTVTDTLLTRTQVGSTLELLGTGTVLPRAQEVALRVRAGAVVEGVSQHGELRVGGPSCMAGALSVSDIYGPVTVSMPGGALAPYALTVDGDAAVTNLDATDTVTADTVAAASSLTVRGFNASPMALADAWAAVAASVVTVVTSVPVGEGEVVTYSQQGFVVANPDPAAPAALQYVVVTSLFGYPGPYGPGGMLVLGDAQEVTLVYNNGTTVVPGIVAARCTPAATAIVQFNEPPLFAAGAVPVLATEADDEDTPAAGTPVFITSVSPLNGAMQFVAGNVYSPSVSILDTFTSLQVSSAYQFSDFTVQGLGGPMYVLTPLGGPTASPTRNLAVKVVGMLQHGPDGSNAAFLMEEGATSTLPGDLLLYTYGGCRGRVIKHFTDEFFASGGVATTLSLPLPLFPETSRPPAAVGLTPIQRALSGGGLGVGGVTSAVLDGSGPQTAVDAAQQYTRLNNVGPSPPPAKFASILLGTAANNTPSLLDAAIKLYKQDSVVTLEAETVLGPSGATTIGAVALPFSNAGLFNHNSPAGILTASVTNANSTVFLPAAVPQYLYMDTLKMTLAVQAAPAAQLVTLAFGTYGDQVGGGYYTSMLLFLGVGTQVAQYIAGLPAVWRAWGGDGPSPPVVSATKIVALAAVTTAGALQFATNAGNPYVNVGFNSGGVGTVTLFYDQAGNSGAPRVTVTLGGAPSAALSLNGGFPVNTVNSFSFFEQPSGTTGGVGLSGAVGAQGHTYVAGSSTGTVPTTIQLVSDILPRCLYYQYV
jgi:hypothetical protein